MLTGCGEPAQDPAGGNGEGRPATAAAAESSTGARYMLALPRGNAAERARLAPSELALGAAERSARIERFKWVRLTEKGPASGSDPVVGKGSGAPHYAFKDGQPYPYYIIR